MTRHEYRQACRTVEVLCELLATEVRSCTTGDADAKRLEQDVEAVADRFAHVAQGAIATAADRRRYERYWQALAKAKL